MEVYKGIKGALNYKDKKMADSLRAAIEKKMQQDPSFASTFVPASSREELRLLYNEHCTDDAVITEEYVNPKKDNASETIEVDSDSNTINAKKENEDIKVKADSNGQTNFIDEFDDEISDAFEADPLKTGNRIKRDYVLDDGYVDNAIKEGSEEGRTSFAEPTTAEQAFEIKKPMDNGSPFTTDEKGQAKRKEEPFNPSFNDMDAAKKKRATKRFAKTVAKGFCTLAEKGIIWFGTKNITEAKLTEYQLTGELNVNLKLNLGDEQMVTVSQFFRHQRELIEQTAKFDNEFQEELEDLLFEWLLEKGFVPNNSQNLGLFLIEGILLQKGIPIAAIMAQQSEVLNQLRAIRQSGTENQYASSTDNTPPHETFADNAPPTQTAKAAPQSNEDFFDGDGGNSNFVEKGLSILDSQQ